MNKAELKKLMDAELAAEQDALKGRSKRPPAGSAKRSHNGNDDAPAPEEVSVHLPIPQQTELVFLALEKSKGPGLVLHGGKLGRVVQRAGRAILEEHTRESLRGHLARSVRFMKKSREEGWRETNPSLQLMDDILTLPQYPATVPVVRMIKSSPLLTAKGELVATSGLYPEHEVYLDLDPTLEGLRLPEKITAEQLDAAVETLLDPFQDFPVEPESVGNLFGLVFTMVLRELIDGVTPLFIVDANTRGTGKGLLVSVASMIAYGREADFSPSNVSSDELRKRLFAVFRQGLPLHVLDNIEKVVWSPELSAVLTSGSYADRVLGASEQSSYLNNLIIIGTGNNTRLGGDIPRRTVLIRLTSVHPRPEERKDFVYPDLLGHVRANRRKILRSVYTIAAAWLRAGRPVPKSAPAMGSFQPWSNFAAGILDVVGATGLLENRDQLRARDHDEEEHETMLTRARQSFGTKEFSARELVSVLDPDDHPAALSGGRLHSINKAMGHLLTRIEGRAFGDEHLLVRHVRTVDKIKHYRVEVAAVRTKEEEGS